MNILLFNNLIFYQQYINNNHNKINKKKWKEKK